MFKFIKDNLHAVKNIIGREMQAVRYDDFIYSSIEPETKNIVRQTAAQTLGGLYDLGFRNVPRQLIWVTDHVVERRFSDGKLRWECGHADTKKGVEVTIHDGSLRTYVSATGLENYENALKEAVAHEIVHNALRHDPPALLKEFPGEAFHTHWQYKTSLRENFVDYLTDRILKRQK